LGWRMVFSWERVFKLANSKYSMRKNVKIGIGLVVVVLIVVIILGFYVKGLENDSICVDRGVYWEFVSEDEGCVEITDSGCVPGLEYVSGTKEECEELNGVIDCEDVNNEEDCNNRAACKSFFGPSDCGIDESSGMEFCTDDLLFQGCEENKI